MSEYLLVYDYMLSYIKDLQYINSGLLFTALHFPAPVQYNQSCETAHIRCYSVVVAVHHPATITTLIENPFPTPQLLTRISHGTAVSNPPPPTPTDYRYRYRLAVESPRASQ
jgi:hypothetical protein